MYASARKVSMTGDAANLSARMRARRAIIASQRSPFLAIGG